MKLSERTQVSFRLHVG